MGKYLSISAKLTWNKEEKKKLEEVSNIVPYEVARNLLDVTFSHIPKDTGKMRKTSMSAGVRGSNGDYYIGSYTSYAMRVWLMPSTTNWSEPGTYGKWYERVWTSKGDMMLQNSLKRNGYYDK